MLVDEAWALAEALRENADRIALEKDGADDLNGCWSHLVGEVQAAYQAADVLEALARQVFRFLPG